MVNLNNITFWKINPFVKITPKKFRLKYDIVPDPDKFRLNIRAHLMLFFENPTHVPLSFFAPGKPAIFTNMAPPRRLLMPIPSWKTDQ